MATQPAEEIGQLRDLATGRSGQALKADTAATLWAYIKDLESDYQSLSAAANYFVRTVAFRVKEVGKDD